MARPALLSFPTTGTAKSRSGGRTTGTLVRFPECNIAGREGGPSTTPPDPVIPIRNGADPAREERRGEILLLP